MTRPRFSLLNLLLLLTAAGFAFGMWRKDRDLAPLRAENAAQAAELHELRGGIEVTDPDRMYVKTPDAWMDPLWHERYSVYVPPDPSATVSLLKTITDSSGVTEEGANAPLLLEPGYSTIELFVAPDARGRGWRWEFGVPNSSIRGLGPRPPWIGEGRERAKPAERRRTPPDGLPADTPFSIIDETAEQEDGTRARVQLEVKWTPLKPGGAQ